MPRIISALLVAFSSAAFAASAWAQPTQPLELAPGAPDRHAVVAGDTLWGISGKFIKDPYRWPELWRLNAEQVKNPHRIYPGQVLVLDKSGDDPQLKLETVRLAPKQYDTPLTQEIPAIPRNVIEPFLAKPLVIEANALDVAPRIIAIEDNRLLVATGGKIYVTGIGDAKAQSYQIYRPGKALADPDTREVLGHEAIFLGTAKVTRQGEPAILRVDNAIAEIGKGDRLVPMSKPDVVSYVPHAPKQAIDGRVMSIVGALAQGGQRSIVTLTRGKKDGLEMGHVLALRQAGAVVTGHFKDEKETFKLPDERYGLIFVFRAFDRISYALVMDASQEVEIGDLVRTP
ncbi:MAG: LysM peptidoglycan-binding domain-containing protein [Sulfurisoma sp.]|nr:LysM peptidoglycan-binding domain-containing protein [Sulfurisoma sp.]